MREVLPEAIEGEARAATNPFALRRI